MKQPCKILTPLIFALSIAHSFAQVPGKVNNTQRVLLPNGWSLSPAGRSLPLGDLPLNIQLSRNEKFLAVTNNGQSTQSIKLIDVNTEKVLDEKVVGKSWYGLQFGDKDDKLYVSGGNDNIILVYPISHKKLSNPDTVKLGKPWPVKISPAGLAVDEVSQRLYVVTKEDNSLYTIDLKSRKTIHKQRLESEAYSCILSPDKNILYISLWGANKLAVYNIKQESILETITTQYAPNELLLNKNGSILYVANGGDNSVSVINTSTRKVIEVIGSSVHPTHLTGSTTNGLALSDNGDHLFIANADNNCLAVFNVSEPGHSVSEGFIPTGWYPTSVKYTKNRIWVANGKGFTSFANPKGPQPLKNKDDDSDLHEGSTANKKLQYIGGLFKGTLSIIDYPNQNELKNYTQQVYTNTPFNRRLAIEQKNNPIPFKKADVSPIKYVFYIIKENRTYDQVLGDVKKGNGDPSLCLFPEKVTPNIHALANQFVLLDNFYVDAEVSADGHNWSMGAYANDYTEKTWPTQYGKRGGSGDYGGKRKITYPRDGFIWDYCKRAGISYRSYGEFTDGKTVVTPVLDGHFCPGYPSFDFEIKDTTRFSIWKRDFEDLLAKDMVPRFNTIKFPNDHTSGQKKGKISPTAAVADNDLAVGLFVDHLSHSKIWKESAIFILEDDAQNGPDHVDAHRSPALVISPYTKRNEVVNTMYSTSGFLRTMELILGLPPMSQYDAAATPLYNCFTNKPDFSPYNYKNPGVDLEERNLMSNESSKVSESFNLAREDAAPDKELNEVVWKSVKGESSVMPAPRRSAFVFYSGEKDDDD
ncbi:bifunctional YncE family protein/alkaline phosphatase family protein [Desertivirga arenae]|uniref:bifunctional YncE family protein/alkaline phosphatase family protein n=1 Tax=Desertivirga arenae TaxID=2810309 RepID=UPI001A95A4BA|nr:bifunctional YncE family protein/alkaline phosphatase family protein [Pedobacter sp. SYSU D00823]